MTIMPLHPSRPLAPGRQAAPKRWRAAPARLAAALALALAGASSAATDATPGEPSRTRAAPKAAATFGYVTFSAPAPTLDLPAPSARAAKALEQGSDGGGPAPVGFPREIPATAAARVLASIRWEPASTGGWAGRFAVRSPGAAALRVALSFDRLPSGLALHFADAAGTVRHGPYAGPEIADALGSTGVFWGPVVDGESQYVEVRLPPGDDPSRLGLAIASASHLISGSGLGFDPAAGRPKAAGACHEDVACMRTPSQAFVNASRSVAKIVYTVDGMSYTCSGTLVNDADAATQVPYLLTAKHCIGSPEAAATANTFWFFEAAACGSKSSGPSVQLTRGALLLYAGSVSDIALIRLKEHAPAGAWFSGLDARAFSAEEPAISIHHPAGELKKVASGIVVNPAEGTSGRLASVAWLFGTTEPGSSGAGLFAKRDGEYRVGGTLRGGSASCASSGATSDPSNRDYYARLDLDLAALRPHLLAAAAPLEDYSDLWYDPADPGWGLSLAQHASNALFAVWFTHDEEGRPQWYAMPGGRWTSSTTFEGRLYRTRRAGSAVLGEEAGSASLRFTGAAEATFSYRVGSQARTVAIQRQPF